MKKCPLCNGEMAKGTLKGGNADATIVIAGKPDGFLGVIPYTTAQIIARVCRSCGYIALFAKNAQDILNVDDNE